MVTRVLTLLAALLVAAVGAGLVLTYVAQADRRAAEEYDGVTVYLALQDVAANTRVADAVSNNLIAPVEISKTALQDGTLQDLDDTQLMQPIREAMVKGQQLLATNIGLPEQADRLGLGSDSNAVFVTLEDPNRLAGVLTPGAMVSVYLTYTPPGESTTCTRLLVDSIEVVSVDGRGSNDAETVVGAASGNVGLKVTNDNQANLIQAQTMGELYFVLLGPGTTPPTNGTCVEPEDVFKVVGS